MSTEFLAFARACGLDITHIPALDRIVRVPTFNKPSKRNGALLLRSDGNGWCIAYDQGGELNWFNDPRGRKEWTEEEKRRWINQKRAQELETARKHQRAAEQAQAMMASCTVGQSGYLSRKGFPDKRALILPDGGTFVPMRDLFTNEMKGAQVIRWIEDERRWEKKFTFGTNPKLAVLRLGPAGPVASILCEGLATAYSIEAAALQMRLTCAVLVCFSAGNIIKVAKALENAPYDRCVLADHDPPHPREVEKMGRGEEFEPRGAGELAAIETGLAYTMPAECGMDVNDVHQKRGLLAACKLVMDAVRAARK